MGHIAAYVRISKDDRGNRLGVERQEQDCREYAQRLWPAAPVRVYCDNDLTAADPLVERPQFLELLEDVRAGDVVELVAFEQSRFTRQPTEWEQLCLVCSRAGLNEVHTVKAGPVSVAPENRLVGRIMSAVDAEEVERMKVRILRSHRQLAEQGRPPGGYGYGYRPGVGADGRPTLEVVESEAVLIRRMAQMVLDGHSNGAIAKVLNDEGHPTARGGTEWRRTAVRAILQSPRIAALRCHRGEHLTPAAWEPILDRATWDRVQHLLHADLHLVGKDGKTRRVNRARPRSMPRTYLLSSGLSFCSMCDTALSSGMQARRNKPYIRSYTCRKVGCGAVSIGADVFEAFVTDQVHAALAGLNLDELMAGRDNADEQLRLAHEIADTETRLGDLARMYAAGELSKGEWNAARDVATERATRARTALAAIAPPVTVDLPMSGDEVVAEWDNLTLAQRRAVIAIVIEKITLLRATPGVKRFDPERVRIHWLT